MSDKIDQSSIVLGWMVKQAIIKWNVWLDANEPLGDDELNRQHAILFLTYMDEAFAKYPDNSFASREELTTTHKLALARSREQMLARIEELQKQESKNG